MPNPSTILLVDDEDSIQTLLTYPLERDGYRVVQARDGEEALARFAAEEVDLVVLDVMLPKLDGLEVCKRLRGESTVPIIMLTARGDEADRIVGLEMGADDYVVKPFSPKEVAARVRALFRRVDRPREGDTPLTFGDLVVDPSRRTARWKDREVRLTAKEFGLLVALLEADGRVLSRQALLEDVWGYSYAEGTRTVDVHVRRLREKLPEIAGAIVTVKSLGYRLSADGGD
jgi:DNA-binding response OmpR family regulator